jgi:hypothetical protein
MRFAVAGALAATAFLAVVAQAQVRHPELTKPRDYDADSEHPQAPGVPVSPSMEERSLLERAQRMHNQAYGLRDRANELRDDDKYDEAEALDDRADEYDARALDMERRAERERMNVKGPFKPAQ